MTPSHARPSTFEHRVAPISIATMFVALFASACVTVDASAPFVNPDAGALDTSSDAGAYGRCRLLDRRFVTNVQARVYGEASGPQAVCLTLQVTVPGAAPGVVLFCVAGSLASLAAPIVKDLTADLQTCAYCTDVQTNCTSSEPDGGTGTTSSTTCGTAYAVLTGRVRIVRFSTRPGDTVWIDLGDLEVARVTRREGSLLDVERRDCIFADALTLQGTLERGDPTSCTGIEATACAIASSAASRTP